MQAERPALAMTPNNLAVLSKAQCRRIETVAMRRRALAISGRLFRTEHLKVVTRRNNYFINTNAPNSGEGCDPAIGRLSSLPSYTPDKTGWP